MSDKRISELPLLSTTPADTDLLAIVNNNITKRVTALTLKNYMSSGISSFTEGSVIFSNGTTLAEDNANFFWDDTNNRLGIGTNTPSRKVEIVSPTLADVIIRSQLNTSSSQISLLNDQASNGRSVQLFYTGSSFAGAAWTSGPTGESAGLGTIGAYPLSFATNSIARLVILSNGNTGFGISAPTALIHIAAGTISIAPIRLTSGSLTTGGNILAGNLEFLTDKLYCTITTGTARKEITLNDQALTSGRIPYAFTNGRLIDSSSFTIASGAMVVTNLVVNTNFQLADGTEGANKVLISDSVGNGTWQTPSSTYTPTYVTLSNLDSTPAAYVSHFYRVGNIVTVSGIVGVNPTSTATQTSFSISLPIASNFGAITDVHGLINYVSNGQSGSGGIEASIANDLAIVVFDSISTTDGFMKFIFTYLII